MVLVVFLGQGLFIGIGISNIIEISKYDILISMFIGTLIGLIPILLICYLNKKNMQTFDLINSLFNKNTSNIIKLIFVISLCFTLVTLTNDFINFANVKYLFETNNYIIAALFIFPAFYISQKGSEVIGRTAQFLFFISIVIFTLNSFALIDTVDINNLKPIMVSGITNILKGSLYFIIYIITPIFFVNIIPKNNESYKTYNKYLVIGYIISAFSIIIITFFVMTVYNYQYISLFSYPAYFTLKKISYGFIQNVENILSFFFIIDYFFFMLILLYSVFKYFNSELNLKNKKLKIVSFIFTIILIVASNYYKDNTIALDISKSFYIYFNLIFLALFLILLVIKSKKKVKIKDLCES